MQADMSDTENRYRNPVASGFFPDPSVVRVGDDYYMVNSTFQYFPAIVVSHSRDLVHWRIIGHAIANGDYIDLSELADSHGIWAPDISFHDCMFYVYATLRLNNPQEGVRSPLRRQLLVRSVRPEGPYSRPVVLNIDSIDPSLFVDDDGRKYMVISPGITLVPLDADGTGVAGDAVAVWAGTGRPCPEGPHLLKRNGYYYAMLAEGGTGYGHCVTLARSRSLYGPYEPCPYNPVLIQTDPASPIQRSGHGKLVETPAGDWWILYLCGRPNGGMFTTLGRETALDPVRWTEDGWFVVNDLAGPSLSQKRPSLPPYSCDEQWFDDFEGPELSAVWQFVRNPDPEGWSLSERPGFYRIRTGDHGLDSVRAKNTLLRREKHHAYSARLRLEFSPEVDGQEAGLVCYYGVRNHICLCLASDGGLKVRLRENRNGVTRVLGEREWKCGVPVLLRSDAKGQTRTFYAASDRGDWTGIGVVDDCTFLSDEGVTEGKHHTGTMVGLYAHNGGSGVRAIADFDWFDYRFGQDAGEDR